MMILRNKIPGLRHYIAAIFIINGLLANFYFIQKAYGAEQVNADGDISPILTLRVDKTRHARAFVNGMSAVLSIGNFFEFYEMSIIEGRKRISSGPWNSGVLYDEANGVYTLRGRTPSASVDYQIVFKQLNPSTIELSLDFEAPAKTASLSFDILKLSGDLFKGAAIETEPTSISDKKIIPVEPLPVNKRMLLTKKNRVLLKGALCDLEIQDTSKSKSILAADFRNVSWDKHKSIYIGGEKKNLSPGRPCSFRYIIKCFPSSYSEMVPPPFVNEINTPGDQTPQNPGSSAYADAENARSFFIISPKEKTNEPGQYQLLPQDNIYGSSDNAALKMLEKEIRDLTSIEMKVQGVYENRPLRGIIIEKIPDDVNPVLPAEGFEIISSPEKIIIRGVDERGCLYGVYTLLSLLKQDENGNWSIDCGVIRDWPDLSVRGICMEMLTPAIRDIKLMKRYIDAFSRARSNVVIFLHYPRHVRAWLKNVDDGACTPEQMTEIVEYARSLHMDVWGGMVSRFRKEHFSEMEIKDGANIYNPLNEESYQYVLPLYEKILETYHPETLLIAHDEIMGLSLYSAESGKSTSDIFASDINFIHNWLEQHNVRTAIWGDMLLDYKKWGGIAGGANSLNPHFNSGDTGAALEMLSNDIIVLDWHYDFRDNYRSVEYFREKGFEVLGASWHNPKAARSLVKSVKKYKGQGIFATDWGFWRTLSPAATSLCAPLCGWTSGCREDEADEDVTAMAEMLKDSQSLMKNKQIPVDIVTYSNESTQNIYGVNGNGFFDAGEILNLKDIPTGKQLFNKVIYNIGTGDDKNNCVIVSNNKDANIPESKEIFRGAVKSEAIAFLHTCFVDEPQTMIRKLGQYEIEYENGHVETVNILENWNITDVRSSEGLRHNSWSFIRDPDILIGSDLAWSGYSSAAIPINLQSFVWENPYTDQTIRSIRLNSSKAPSNTRLVILGVTCLQ